MHTLFCGSSRNDADMVPILNLYWYRALVLSPMSFPKLTRTFAIEFSSPSPLWAVWSVFTATSTERSSASSSLISSLCVWNPDFVLTGSNILYCFSDSSTFLSFRSYCSSNSISSSSVFSFLFVSCFDCLQYWIDNKLVSFRIKLIPRRTCHLVPYEFTRYCRSLNWSPFKWAKSSSSIISKTSSIFTSGGPPEHVYFYLRAWPNSNYIIYMHAHKPALWGLFLLWSFFLMSDWSLRLAKTTLLLLVFFPEDIFPPLMFFLLARLIPPFFDLRFLDPYTKKSQLTFNSKYEI